MSAPTAQSQYAGFPLFRLLVLTGAIFVSVSSEFLPTGLLREMAVELGVSESRVGLLVTVFAATVVISTAPLAVLTRRVSRKWLMVGLLTTFAISNLAAAAAPTYEFLVAARILGGLAHGLFWAVTGPYASHLVPRRQLGRAIAVTNAGGTAAFVLGVPLGTALGQALGWRWAFVIMAVVVLVFMLLVVIYLPPVQHLEELATGEIRIPTHRDKTVPAVLVVCVTVVLIITGQNVFYTYISPWLQDVATFTSDAVPGLLFAYGAAGAVGLLIAGVLGDRFPRASIATLIGAVAVAVALLAVSATVPWAVVASLVFWSIAFGGIPSLFHAKVLHTASHNIRDIAAAWLTTSFNLAIGGGALLGGLLLDNLGLDVLPWAMIIFVIAGLAFLLSIDLRRSRAARAERSATDYAMQVDGQAQTEAPH